MVKFAVLIKFPVFYDQLPGQGHRILARLRAVRHAVAREFLLEVRKRIVESVGAEGLAPVDLLKALLERDAQLPAGGGGQR